MIFGLEPRETLPEHWTPLEATAVIKCLDENGEPTVFLAATQNLAVWDSIGLLTVALDVSRESASSSFTSESDDE